MLALIAALVSVAFKEALYRYTVFKGKRLNSQAVVANAWHHRSDALSSIGTAIGIGGLFFGKSLAGARPDSCGGCQPLHYESSYKAAGSLCR